MSLWPRLADLELTIDRVDYGRLDPGPGAGGAHATRVVRLLGDGQEGLGEDITLFMTADVPELSLAGDWTLADFCAHLGTVEQWVEPPADYAEMVQRWRNWAYESAALDLALQQAGQPLHAVLGLGPRPVTFVNSLGLGDPPGTDSILRRLERYPGLRLKLDVVDPQPAEGADPVAAWSPEVIETLVATGAVHTLDFKGQYGFAVEDEDGLAGLYVRLLDAFPDVVLEDPHDLPAVTPLIEPHAARVAYDAPIATVADLDATPVAANAFNIKPTRIGSLQMLFALYAECERRGALVYGGGMGELGVGRGQIQLLASLLSPDGPNDVAPPGFNAVDPAAGLPTSPLDPAPAPTGFRRDESAKEVAGE